MYYKHAKSQYELLCILGYIEITFCQILLFLCSLDYEVAFILRFYWFVVHIID
jgi:hypothetical protein